MWIWILVGAYLFFLLLYMGSVFGVEEYPAAHRRYRNVHFPLDNLAVYLIALIRSLCYSVVFSFSGPIIFILALYSDGLEVITKWRLWPFKTDLMEAEEIQHTRDRNKDNWDEKIKNGELRDEYINRLL